MKNIFLKNKKCRDLKNRFFDFPDSARICRELESINPLLQQQQNAGQTAN